MFRLPLFSFLLATVVSAAEPIPLFHTITLDFEGPNTSETVDPNPFTDTRLVVDFTNGDTTRRIRGFYAADGDAANSGATSGNVWRVRFTPEKTGTWTYRAALRSGGDIAISTDPKAGAEVTIKNAGGSFDVGEGTDAATPDFRARGRLSLRDGNFYFAHTQKYWMKGGTNSPENLLAYADFDDTYRTVAEAREGEAAAPDGIHSYAPHRRDWRPGDPTWGDGKGKALIGAVNYLASKGINASYFLTMNIGGDGKDVWPYTGPETLDRFDVSKLAQWEIVFSHMQRHGILLHLVTQETENEKLLDAGETGRLRKLYYQELIARFGHHLALTWNLGEENGPAHFSPDGQTPAQQKAMATYLKDADPYRHPVFLHTHATDKNKDDLLPDLLSHTALDALSFQVNKPETVNSEIIKWREASAKAGHPWTITMDEIGPWQDGAVPDSVDPDHDHLRRHVLWGALLGGAAGVEWYSGAHHPHNDLTNEDFRAREALWIQTSLATRFMDAHVPYWRMDPHNELVSPTGTYCLADPGSVYLVYVPASTSVELDLQAFPHAFTVHWFSPTDGGALKTSDSRTISGTGTHPLSPPPSPRGQDWIALIKKTAGS